ncbi:MAG: TolC family protein [Alphaproteobacteria bacterium]
MLKRLTYGLIVLVLLWQGLSFAQDTTEALPDIQETADLSDEEVKGIPTTFSPDAAVANTSMASEKSATKESSAPTSAPFSVSLMSSMMGAYQQSPLLTAEYQVKAAQMGLSTARRDWLPTAQANLKYTRDSAKTVNSSSNPALQSSPTGISTADTKQGSVRVEQNLYNGGATTAGIEFSAKQVDAATAEYLMTEKAILFKAIKDHIDYYSKQKVLDLNQKNQDLLQESYRIAKARHEFGEATLYDAAATKAKLEKAKSDTIRAVAELKASEAAYLKDTGINPARSLEQAAYPANLLPKSKEEAIYLTLQHSPELKKRDADADAAKASVDKVFGGLLPSFAVGATARRTLSETDSTTASSTGRYSSRVNDLGGDATLSIPLDFRGSTQTSIKQYKYAAAQKRLEALHQRRDVIEKTSQAWDIWQATKATIDQVKAQVDAAKIAVDMAKEEYLAGSKQTIDVLASEQEYFSAQVELVRSEQGEVQAAYALLDAMGILRALYLNLEVPLYDPTQDENKIPFWGIGIADDDRMNTVQTSNDEMIKWGTNI